MSDERRKLAEAAEPAGWRRRTDERVDIYLRDPVRVRIIWRGDDAISGGTLFHDNMMMAYSRDFGTVSGWLKR
ncbi:hypothetical protein LV457_13345 [Mycobacterium sp. MYCO198283]|uniref:hypothetical protein n=1 Tax=Mycobacterium sp. MYCO198283 TaxID=2883505 RepID=UPI001E298FFD|nr:hypothetical protein [Mycobacterium sp. MYCO198283]MCG5433264.1 hypothetical protein [Mycobacterium sp. MYCO198283]